MERVLFTHLFSDGVMRKGKRDESAVLSGAGADTWVRLVYRKPHCASAGESTLEEGTERWVV